MAAITALAEHFLPAPAALGLSHGCRHFPRQVLPHRHICLGSPTIIIAAIVASLLPSLPLVSPSAVVAALVEYFPTAVSTLGLFYLLPP